MKAALIAILASFALLHGADVSQNVNQQTAVAPEFKGDCSGVVDYALHAQPQLLGDAYFIGSAVDITQDLKVSWQINNSGNYDGAAVVSKLTADANCLKPELLEEQVKERLHKYQQILRDRTNPLIDQISSAADVKSKDDTKSTNYVKDFTFQGDPEKADGFFGGFLAEIKEPYKAAQTYVVLTFILIALVSLGGEWIFFNINKITKNTGAAKASTVEVMHRFAIGIPLFLIFYSQTGITTKAQDMFSSWVAEGSNLADALANKVHVSNAKYTIRELGQEGGITAKELEKKVRGVILLEQQAQVNAEIMTSCMETYNIEALKQARKGKSDLIFPASAAELGESQWDFEQYYVNNKMNAPDAEASQAPKRYFSVESCAAAEGQLRDYAKKANVLNGYFEKLQNFDTSKLQYVVTGGMKKNITMGWTSVALLPAQQAMQSQTSMLDTQLDRSAWDNVEFDWSLSGLEKFYNSYQNFSFTRTIESMTQRAAFLFVPGANGVYTTTSGYMDAAVSFAAAPVERIAATAEKGSDAVKTALNAIPVAGPILAAIVGGLGGIATWGLTKIIALSKLAMIKMGPFYLATEAAKIMIESLVYIFPMLVTAFVIVWWYVEVFLYMIAVPFAGGYAFGENAKANIIQFIIKGIGLAFKPMLIVLSVFLAVKGMAMLESITTGMITTQEMAMVAQANTILDKTEWSIGSPLDGWVQWIASVLRAGMIQGVLFIAVAITKVILVSSVILKGPGFFLGLFNINVESNGSEAIASKISTVTKGI